MRKRATAWLLAVVLTTGLTALTPALAEEADFVIENGVLVEYTGAGGEVAVPDGVTVIDTAAFRECAGLTKTDLPGTVRTIRPGAFADSGLQSVTVPAAVESLQAGAFINCRSLTGATVLGPDTVLREGCLGFWSQWTEDGMSIDREAAFTLTGWPGSTAEAYARDNGFAFVPLEGTPPAPDRPWERVELETVLAPAYDDVLSFSEGLAAVRFDNGLWGYIDEQGTQVIPPRYDIALSFHEGVALAARNDGSLHPDWEAVYLLKPDGTEIPLHEDFVYVTRPDGSVEPDSSGNGPLVFSRATETFDNFTCGCSGGVVRAMGSAYTPDGQRIRPESYDGFALGYQDYEMTGPAVDGIIPCRALFWNRDAHGQCFYMEADGTVLALFPSADWGGTREQDNVVPTGGPGVIQVYAPDPETGRIPALEVWRDTENQTEEHIFGVYQGSTDLRNHLEDWETWEPYMLSLNPGFRNLRLNSSGSIFHHGFASIWLGGDDWALLRAENDPWYFLSAPELESWWRGGQVMGTRTFEALGEFGLGAEDVFCPVKENGSWHYVDTYGCDYPVEGPGGGLADLEIAGDFNNGYAPVYDRTSGTAYLITAHPVRGVLPMVKGTESLAADVYFPGFTPGGDLAYGLTREVEELVAVRGDNGKLGFAALRGSTADILTGTMTAGDGSRVDWSLDTDTGTVSVGGVGPEDAVLAAYYDESGRLLQIARLTRTAPEKRLDLIEYEIGKLSLFWVDGDLDPNSRSAHIQVNGVWDPESGMEYIRIP